MKNKSIYILFLFFCICSAASSQSNKANVSVISQEVLPDSIYPPESLSISYHTDWAKTHYPERIKQFKSNPLEYGDVVFLGNSITEFGGDWGSRFNSSIVKNRGIAGDVTEGVLARLSEIRYFKPVSVFILIGINDIFVGKAPEFVAGNIIKITKNIHQYSPNTKIYVQTILPTSSQSNVTTIKATNNLLLSSASSNNYTVIDLHTLFADAQDIMKVVYTTDGVHLSEEGYKVWVNKVEALIPSNQSSNLLKNADLKEGTTSWDISGTPNMFGTSTRSSSEPALVSIASKYWEWPYSIEGSIKQTVTNIQDGKYTFSCQFSGQPIAGSKSYSALIATDGNGIVTIKPFTIQANWEKIILNIDVTGGKCSVGFTIKDTIKSVYWFCASDFRLVALNSYATGINDINKMVSRTLKAYPNPFRNETTLSFTLPSAQRFAELKIYNTNGILVQSFRENNVVPDKQYIYKFECNRHSENLYIARLFTDEEVYALKLLRF